MIGSRPRNLVSMLLIALFAISLSFAQEAEATDLPTESSTQAPPSATDLATETPSATDTPIEVVTVSAPEATNEVSPTEVTLSETAPATLAPASPTPIVLEENPVSLIDLLNESFEPSTPQWLNTQWDMIDSEGGKAVQAITGESAPRLRFAYPLMDVELSLRVALRSATLSLGLRVLQEAGYFAEIDAEGLVRIYRNETLLKEERLILDGTDWHSIRFSVVENTLSLSLDQQEILRLEDVEPLVAGFVDISADLSELDSLVRVDDVKLRTSLSEYDSILPMLTQATVLPPVSTATLIPLPPSPTPEQTSDTREDDDVVTGQAQLFWGQTVNTCHSTGTSATHTWWFDSNYWNYILDFGRTSGDLRYNVYITGPGINGTLPSTPDGRLIIYGPDNGGGSAGNYSLTITGTSGSGCVNTTIWSGYRPQNQIGWGFQSSHHSMKKWRYNTGGQHFLRIERMEGSGTMFYRVWNPSGTLVVDNNTTNSVAVFALNDANGEYNVEIDAGNGSYRWSVNSGFPTLTAASTVTVSNRTANSFRVTWNDPNSQETSIQPRLGATTDANPPAITTLGENSTAYTFTGLQCGTSYKVIIRFSHNSQTVDSAAYTFSTLPCAPALLTPVNGSLNVLRPTFTWSPATPATGYQLRYGTTNPPSTTPISISGGSTSSYAVPSNLPAGTTYWQMRSVNGADIGDWSAVASFTVNTIVPANTNLIQNGSFANTVTNWTRWGNLNWTVNPDQTLSVSRQNETGGLYQQMSYATTAGMGFEMTFEMENPTNEVKTILAGFYGQSRWGDSVNCYVNMERKSPRSKYIIRGSAQNWSYLQAELALVSENNGVAIIDNVTLTHVPALNNAPTSCSWDAAPANINLVTNGTFDTEDSWFTGSGLNYSIADGFVTYLSKPGSAAAALANDIARSLALNSPVEMTFRIWNTGTENRNIKSGINRQTDWSGSVQCEFIVPPSTDYLTYTMRGRVSQVMAALRAQINITDASTSPNLRVDDVVVQYKPSLTISSPTGTDCIPPNIPTPVAPVISDPTVNITTNNQPTFVWNSVDNATSYIIELSLNGFSTIALSETLTTNSYTPASTLADGSYSIRVRGLNVLNQAGANSAIKLLTIDTTPPAQPTLNAPANNASLTTTRPSLSWLAVTGASNYRVQADDSEAFDSPEIDQIVSALSYTPPTPLVQGVYFWRVLARDAAGNESVPSNLRSFTLSVQLSPAPNQVFTTASKQAVAFSWASAIIPYTLEIARDEFFNDIVFSRTQTLTTYTLSSTEALTHGHYWWRVIVNGQLPSLDVKRKFTVAPPAPPTPSLSSPANAFNTNNPNVTLAWTLATYAPVVMFEIQVDNQSTFASPEYSETNISGLTTITTSLADGTYSWRVRALNEYGAASAWSTPRTFLVDTVAPTLAPNLTAPVNNVTVSTVRPAFTWQATAGMKDYRLLVDDDEFFASPEINVIATGTSYTPPTNLPLNQGAYFWKVIGRDAATNEGPDSAVRRLVINLQTSPNHNQFFNTATKQAVAFSWASVGITGTQYTVEISTDETFNNILFSRTQTGTSYTLSAIEALPHGYYWWRILVNGIVAPAEVQRKFIVAPPTPPPPTLTSPAASFLTNNPQVTLTWTLASYAYPVTFEVMGDNQNTFASPEYSENNLFDRTSTTPALSDGTYSWRVRAVNEYGAPSAWSSVRAFVVDTTAPSAPSLSTPLNNAVLSSTRPSLVSASVATANAYRFDLALDSDFNLLILQDQVSTSTSLALTTTILSMPLDQGVYYVRAQARDAAGNWSEEGTARSFVVSLLTAPANNIFYQNANKQTVAFTWAAYGVAGVSYTLEIARDSAFTDLAFSRTQTGTSYTLTSTEALPHGNYFWRVSVNGLMPPSEATRRLTVSPPAPPVPAPQTLSDNAVINQTQPSFTWLAVSYPASSIRYEIELDNQSTFASPEFRQTDLTSTNITSSVSLADGLYYWRIRTVNAYGLVSAWSTTRRFTLDTTPPPVPVLSAPADTASLTSLRPALTWLASATAARYEVRLASDNAFSRSLIMSATTTSATPAANLNNSVYWWSVRALDSAGNASAWSTARRFTARSTSGSATLTCRSLTPNLTLNWERVSWASGYAYEVATTSSFEPVNLVASGNLTGNPSAPSITTPTLANARYFWRVRAQTSTGTWGAWSAVASCSVDAP